MVVEADLALPHSDEPEVTLVILATRDADRLERCLRAIVEGVGTATAVETIIVVTGRDAGIGRLLERVQGARLARARGNAGTAAAWNLAAEGARGRWVHLLHEDAAPEPGWLDPLVRAMLEHPEAGAVGSRLLEPDGHLQNSGWVLWRDGVVTPVGRFFPSETDTADAPFAVDLCSSASLLIDREDLAAAGMFDERFAPALYVEIDLCTALWEAGRAVLCVPASLVRHETAAMVSDHAGAMGSARLREFLTVRHRALFAERRHDALTTRVSRDACDLGLGGVDRDLIETALAHAAARWRALPVGRTTPAGSPAAAHSGDERWAAPPEREALFAERDAQIRSEFLEWLVAADAERAVELDGARDRLLAMQGEIDRLRERERTLDLILNGGWWRLRDRLHAVAHLPRRLGAGWRRRRR